MRAVWSVRFDLLTKEHQQGRLRASEAGEPESASCCVPLIASLERWTEKEQTQVEVEVLIFDYLFQALPTTRLAAEREWRFHEQALA